MIGKTVDFFCIPTFIWLPTGGGLLNLVKPAQNLYFFWQFFQNFKESVIEYIYSHFGEISPKTKCCFQLLLCMVWYTSMRSLFFFDWRLWSLVNFDPNSDGVCIGFLFFILNLSKNMNYISRVVEVDCSFISIFIHFYV